MFLDAFEAATWQEMTLELGFDQLHLSRRGAPAPSLGLPSEGIPAEHPVGRPVTAPSIGLFWHARSPDAPALVEVGTRVTGEGTVGILEVTDLRRPISAGFSGVVTAILVENGTMVEYGQPLLVVAPDG